MHMVFRQPVHGSLQIVWTWTVPWASSAMLDEYEEASKGFFLFGRSMVSLPVRSGIQVPGWNSSALVLEPG